MGMIFIQILVMAAGLAITLGLFGLAVWAWRRYAPAGLLPLSAARQRRMSIVESLVLGANHRLILMSLDGQERLILLGEGSLLPSRSAPEDHP
jgi:flagellar protein FliO/FliZ